MGRNKKDFDTGQSLTPDIKDVKDAWFSGKVTDEEANDLSGTKEFGAPYKAGAFFQDHAAKYAHQRAGLTE